MNIVRQALEKMYIGTCSITERVSYEKENGATGFKEEIVLSEEPCRLSFENTKATEAEERASLKEQSIRLFLKPEVTVKPGSKVTVTQNGITTDYAHSGVPAVYETHQELMLMLWEKWS